MDGVVDRVGEDEQRTVIVNIIDVDCHHGHVTAGSHLSSTKQSTSLNSVRGSAHLQTAVSKVKGEGQMGQLLFDLQNHLHYITV